MHKTIKRAFSVFYTLIEHGFLTNQRAQGPTYVIIIDMRLLHCFGYYRCDMYAMHVYYFLGKNVGILQRFITLKCIHFVRVFCVYFTNFSCIL